MSRIIIYPYNIGSGSAKALGEELINRGHNVLKVYPDRKYTPRARDTVINWGNAKVPDWSMGKVRKVFNKVPAVNIAGNKLAAFRSLIKGMSHDSIVTFTDEAVEAQNWVNDGHVVVVRNQLRGHSGAGIELVGASIDKGDLTGVVPEAPLYTMYMKKAIEYRVHVFNEQVILTQQKMIPKDFPKDQVNYQIRNHQFGWIFATQNITAPSKYLLQGCVAAVRALELDFGAVDVVFNAYRDEYRILEVNTAPGLEGMTIPIYADAFERCMVKKK